jgi:hypothetical protein
MAEKAEALVTGETIEDPARFFWYFIYVLIMAISALPLFGFRVPQMISSYMTLLVIHEASGFFFFGHTFFSNIWAMRIRMTQSAEVGIWARSFLRKMALGITGPTSVISPLAGLMLVESWGGLQAAPWAWDAYLAFWIMAAVSIVPDVIRYGRNRNSGDPRHGILSGAIRGNIGTVLTFYIIWCMITRQALIAPMVLN